MLASALRPGAALAAALAALALAIASAAALLVVDMNRQAVQDVERGLVGLSAVLADQADRSLQAMEMVQDAVIDGLREAGVATSEEYAAAAGRQDLHLALRARIAALPQVNAITIVDHAGKLLNFSRYWPIPDVNIADRDYFKALAADPGRGRFVGRPVRNRGDGAWTIYVARKVSASDGTFLGLVLGAVELGYFEGLYRQISPTDDAVVSVFRDDGMLLVRTEADIPCAAGMTDEQLAAALRASVDGVINAQNAMVAAAEEMTKLGEQADSAGAESADADSAD